jgi:hypothetical protein
VRNITADPRFYEDYSSVPGAQVRSPSQHEPERIEFMKPQLPEGIEIDFSESLTSEQRQLVEQSIATMIARTRAEADAARARLAEERALFEAINAPVAKLTLADREAAKALEKLGSRKFTAEDDLWSGDGSVGTRDHVIPVSPTDNAVELRVPPFDFAWRWQVQGGAGPFSQVGDRDGRLGLDARSGSLIQGGADRFVNAHIGVGCIVRADRSIVVELSATRSSRHSFLMGAPGLGASAFSEGGLETTFMRGGQVLMAGTLPFWSRRITSGEARDLTNFGPGVYPNGMGGRIDPGDYAFNVGIWAVADHSSGVGGAGVQSLVQSKIIDMSIKRRG